MLKNILTKIFYFSFRNASRAVLATLVLTGVFCSAIFVFAVPPTDKYSPGDTLDPTCIPGSTNCTVAPPAVYGFGTNNFSGTGNFTTTGIVTAGTLKIGSVMTFPTADGTSGQVLQTNGSGVISWQTIDSSGYIPYTGATGAVNLGANLLSTTSGIITPKIYPALDSTTAIQINKADGSTNVLNVDTTNSIVSVGPVWTINGNGGIEAWGGALYFGWGMDRPTKNIISWSGGSGENMEISSTITGYVGIGDFVSKVAGHNQVVRIFGWSSKTGSAGQKSATLQLSDNGVGAYPSFNISGGASTTPIVLQPTSGNVGIGTTTPSSALEVSGSGNPSNNSMITLTTTLANNYSQLYFNSVGNIVDYYTFGNTYVTSGKYIQASHLVDATGAGGLTFNVSYTGAPIRFYTADSEKMRIQGGNVGIGTTAPQSLLDIQGPVGTGTGSAGILTLATKELTIVDGDELGRINFNAPLESDGSDAILAGASIWAEADDTFSATVNSTELVFGTATTSAAIERMRIDSAGNVGIGTASPSGKLHVVGNTYIDGDIYFGGQGNGGETVINGEQNAGFRIYSYGNSDSDFTGWDHAGRPVFQIGLPAAGTYYHEKVTFNPSNYDVDFIVDSDVAEGALFMEGSNGNVGIGTTTPGAMLSVNGTVAIGAGVVGTPGDLSVARVSSPTAGVIYFGNTNTDSYIQGGAGAMSFTTGATTVLNLSSSIINLNTRTDIAGTLYLKYNSTNYTSLATGATGNLTITPNGGITNFVGSVGIGTTTPNRTLEVNGSIRMGALITGAGGAVAVYRDANGDLADSTSSIKYKTNVETMENVLDKINQLNVVRFAWNEVTSTPGMLDFGMISEEVNTILPDLVTFEADGTTPRGLKYEKMGLFAIKGLQEQQKQIKELASKIESLNANGTIGDGSVAGVNMDNAFVIGIKNILATLGINVGDKAGQIKTMRIEKMEMVDSATGDVYCTWIENGEWKKTQGECNSPVGGNTLDSPLQGNDNNNNPPVVEEPPAQEPAPEIPPIVEEPPAETPLVVDPAPETLPAEQPPAEEPALETPPAVETPPAETLITE
jgi:hypothetical protein